MVFLGWGFNSIIFVVCLLLVVYNVQAAFLLENFLPWLDLRVAGILAICASIMSMSVRLYMMLNPPETIVIYWNLIYYSATLLAAILFISVAPELSAVFQVNSDTMDGNGQASSAGSQYDPSLAALGLLGFLGVCAYRIEVNRAG